MNENQSGRDSSKAATKQNMQFRTILLHEKLDYEP
jgi:hypothetical protein